MSRDGIRRSGGHHSQGEEYGQITGSGIGAAGQINLNTASLPLLDSLAGIGPKRAQDIIDQRPYLSVEELLEKKVIPNSVFEQIKDELTVY